MVGIDKEKYGFQRNRKGLEKQPCNKISFKYKPYISFYRTSNLFTQLNQALEFPEP